MSFFENNEFNEGDHSAYTVGYTMPKQGMLWKVVRKRTNENMYQCRTDGNTIHKKGDSNVPWMDWCLGTIFWTHCEDWHPSHCNSRTERPISKSSSSTSIRRRFEWATLSVKTWVPGTEYCLKGTQEQWQKDVCIGFIPTNARKLLNDQLHPDTKRVPSVGPWYELGWILRKRKANRIRSAIILFVYLDPELKLVGLI